MTKADIYWHEWESLDQSSKIKKLKQLGFDQYLIKNKILLNGFYTQLNEILEELRDYLDKNHNKILKKI